MADPLPLTTAERKALRLYIDLIDYHDSIPYIDITDLLHPIETAMFTKALTLLDHWDRTQVSTQ